MIENFRNKVFNKDVLKILKLKGSSKINILGLFKNACASKTFCLLPMESFSKVSYLYSSNEKDHDGLARGVPPGHRRPRRLRRLGRPHRPNVGIIITNQRNEVFWGKRVQEHSWQFPQGGINAAESPQQAMYRELHEEIGLGPQHVSLLGRTRDWLHYDVPVRWVRRE